MISEERKQIIVDLLKEKKIVKVNDLSKMFQTSDVTIRRDLKQLEDEGILKKTHGGAVPVHTVKDEPPFDILQLTNHPQKIAIAQLAFEYVNDNDTILIDSSSTARELALLIKADGEKKVTVVTNSYRTHWEMMDANNVELIHLGGYVRKSIMSSYGPLTTQALKMIRVDKAFIGINGIDADSGYTTPNMFECEVKKAMMHCAKQVFFMADSSKFDKTYLSIVCELERADYLISDSGIPDQYNELFKTINSELLLANV